MSSPTRMSVRLALAATLTVLVAASAQAGEIIVDLTTDNFGGETSFELVEVSSGDTVGSLAQGGQASGTTMQYSFPGLDPGDYDFTITDSFGDGICCGFGLGNYTVTADGVATPSPTGGAFGASETVTVTVTVPEDPCDEPATHTCLAGGRTVSCRGTGGSDFIIGSDGRDVIHGRGGDDFLFGRDGNDVICGGGGEDWIVGGEGRDHLDGGRGDDVLDGTNGNDDLFGGRGDDDLDGGRGNDLCDGEQGSDTFFACEEEID